jgi:hypothetical protein
MDELKAFSVRNRQRCESPNGFSHKISSWSQSDWFVAILGEYGEAAEELIKLESLLQFSEMPAHDKWLDSLFGELADVYIYLDLIQEFGYTVARVAQPDDEFKPKQSLDAWLLRIGCQLGLAANAVKKLNRVRDGIPGNTKSADAIRGDVQKYITGAVSNIFGMAESVGRVFMNDVNDAFAKTSKKIGYVE